MPPVRFRLKLPSGEILGPFTGEKILELQKKGLISQETFFQLFPVGPWKEFSHFSFEQQTQTFATPPSPSVAPLLPPFPKKITKEKQIKEENEEKEDKTEIAYNLPLDFKEIPPDVPLLSDFQTTHKIESPQIELDKNKIPSKQKKILKKEHRLLVLFSIVAVAFFLFPESKEQSQTPIYLNYRFPVSKEKIEIEKSRELYQEGLKNFFSWEYASQARALEQLTSSLEYSFTENKAIAPLLALGVILVKNAHSREKAKTTLFRLFQLVRPFATKDLWSVLAISLFFLNNERPLAALVSIEQFILLNPKEVSFFLLTLYLEAALEGKKLNLAKNIFKKIEPKIQELNLSYQVEVMDKFFSLFNEKESSLHLLSFYREKFPQSETINLLLCDRLVSLDRVQELERCLSLVKTPFKSLGRRNQALWAKLHGHVFALKNEAEKAVASYEQSLQLEENRDLREKLANLRSGQKTSQGVQEFIVANKVQYFLNQALVESTENKNINKAIQLAVEAVDLKPTMLAPKLVLAQLQKEQGLLGAAIDLLEEAYKLFPLDLQVQEELVQIYLKGQKFFLAEQVLKKLSETPLASHEKFLSLLGDYYVSQKNFSNAVKYYSEAINKNPLQDSLYFKLAKIFALYKEWDKSKKLIRQALEINPGDWAYHQFYSELISKTEAVQSAIGYLLALEKQGGVEKSKVWLEMALYYYKNGELKESDLYFKKIEEDPLRPSEYFLRKIELIWNIPQKQPEVLALYHQYFLQNPGDLAERLVFAEYLIDYGQDDLAQQQLQEIRKRFSSMPKTRALLAHIFLRKQQTQKALEEALEEVKHNPSYAYGHTILGLTYQALKDQVNATKSFQMALSLSPEDFVAMEGLASLKVEQNYFEEALELYQKILQHTPHNPNIYRAMGFLYQRIGQRKTAFEHLKKYLEIMPHAPDRSTVEKALLQLH